MIEKTYLEWYPAANQIFRVGFGAHDELIDAQTYLDPDGNTPTVQLHELVDEHPETWNNITSKVSISGIGVVDDDENEMENGAIQFRVAEGATPGDPTPGDVYSFFLVADRADDPTLQVAARAWVRIMP